MERAMPVPHTQTLRRGGCRPRVMGADHVVGLFVIATVFVAAAVWPGADASACATYSQTIEQSRWFASVDQCTYGPVPGCYTAPWTTHINVSKPILDMCVCHAGGIKLPSSSGPLVKEFRAVYQNSETGEFEICFTLPNTTICSLTTTWKYQRTPTMFDAMQSLPAFTLSPYIYYPFTMRAAVVTNAISTAYFQLQWRGIDESSFSDVPAVYYSFVPQGSAALCESGVCTTSISSAGQAPSYGGFFTLVGQWLSPCSQVVVGGYVSSIYGWSSTTITAYVPAGVPGIGYPVTVSCRGVISNTAQFTYTAPIPSFVTGADTDGKSTTIINGISFGPVGVSLSVTIGGKPCTNAVISISHYNITCTAPEGIGENLEVKVWIPAGSTNLGASNLFTYHPPRITSAVFTVVGGVETVIITGNNFGPLGSTDVSVHIGTPACTSAYVSVAHTEIRCQPPANAVGRQRTLAVAVPATSTNQIGTFYFDYPAPIITSASPTTTLGDLTTIMGSRFGVASTDVTVKIASSSCTSPRILNSTTITCTTPAGFGKNLLVQVSIPASGGYSQTGNASVFSYKPPSVSYNYPVPTNEGGAVTLFGSNFGPAGTILNVTIGGKPCMNAQAYQTYIQCTAPSGAGANVSVCIFSDCSSTFSYQKPTIISLSGLTTAGCAPCWIAGTQLGLSSLVSLSVLVDGNPSPSSWVNSSVAQVSLIPFTGTHQLVVVVGGQATSAFPFSPPAPLISSVTTADTNGLTLTYITGNNFGPIGTSVSVTVDNRPCLQAQVIIGHTQIACQPSGVGINQQVKVTVSLPTPQTTTFSPFIFNGPSAYTVQQFGSGQATIYGNNFGFSNTPVAVYLAGVRSSSAVVSQNHTQITFTPPPGVGGNLPLVIVVPDGNLQNTTTTFSYINAPLIISSSTPPTDGLTPLVIKGINFGNVSVSVTVNGINCKQARVTKQNEEITCTPPPGSGKNNRVIIQFPTISVPSITANMSYAAPTVVNSTSCDTNGGTTITVTGTNFGLSTSDVGVTIAGSTCGGARVSVNHTRITCTAPAGSGKSLTLCVTVPNNPDGQVACGPIFSYNKPVITSALPAVESTSTVISGQNFGPYFTNVSVYIDGRLCSNANVSLANSKITCIAPPGAGLMRLVEVRIPATSNTQLVSTNIFNYTGASITNVPSVSTTGSNWHIITGTHFGPVNTVAVLCSTDNGIWLQGSWISSTTVACTIPSGTGTGHTLSVKISQQITNQATLTYLGPVISSVSSADTDGSTLMCIDGDNFGSWGTTLSVSVGGQLCTHPALRFPHTQVCCYPPAGFGSNKNVLLTVYANKINYTTSFTGFSYSGPHVSMVRNTACATSSAILIIGQNFGPIGTPVNVTVNGTICVNASVTVGHSQITCIAPPGTGKGWNITVSLPGFAYSGTELEYDSPRVDSFSTESRNGTLVLKVQGINFGLLGTPVQVTTDNHTCSLANITKDCEEIECLLSISGKISTVSVAIPAGPHSQIGVYQNLNNSVTISTATSTNTTGGLTRITGTNLGNDNTTITVEINGKPCTGVKVIVPEMLLECKAPPGYGTYRRVYVHVVATYYSSSGTADIFSYLKPVVLSSTSVPTDGTQATVITGYNFGPVSTPVTVFILSSPCVNATVTVDHYNITCIPTPGVGVNNTVIVAVPDLTQSDTAQVFSYYAPVISIVNDVSVDGESRHEIWGENFGPGPDGAYTIEVYVNGTKVNTNATWMRQSVLISEFPAGFGGNWTTQVSISGQLSNLFSFNYEAPAIISASSANTDGTSRILIRGQRFGPANESVQVYINGSCVYCKANGSCPCANATVTVADSAITCIAPPGCGRGNTLTVHLPLDPYHVQSASFHDFTYSGPIVIDASSTNTTGGSTTISGYNFGPIGASVNVTIGKLDCTSASITQSDTRIVCTAPPGFGENRTIIVTVASLQSDPTLAFTYNSPAVLRAIFGANGTAYILGYNFGPSVTPVSVQIGSNECENASVTVDHTEISCKTPPGAGANVSVTVWVPPDSSLKTTANVFSYPAPVITGIVSPPTRGTAGAIVKGLNFPPSSAYSVTSSVDGEEFKSATWKDASSILCTIPSGVGRNHSIIVVVEGQPSAPFTFAYRSPSVTSTQTLASQVLIFGENFGEVGTSVSVTLLADLPSCDNHTSIACSEPTVLVNHTTIGCVPSVDFVGSGVTVEVTVPVDPSQSQSETFQKFNFSGPFLANSTQTPTSGGSILVSGTGFGLAGTPVVVKINGNQCMNASVTQPGQIQCISPPGVGEHLVLYVEAGCPGSLQSYSAPIFSYEAPVVVSSTPTSTDGGETEITGNNFGPIGTSIRVTINGIDCSSPTVTSPHTKCTCIAPAGVGANKTVEIWVPASSSLHHSLPIFSYIAPSVSSLLLVPTTGDESHLLIGTDFGQGGTGYLSEICSTSGCQNCSWISTSALSCPFPPGTGKNFTRQVRIANINSENFYYTYEAPIIYNISEGAIDGLSLIHITGNNFGSVSSVLRVVFSGDVVPCAGSGCNCRNVTVTKNQTEISCYPPPGVGTGVTVTLYVPDDVSHIQLATAFFSYEAPVILSALPTNTTGGLSVLTGQNFGPNGTKVAIEIAGESCTNPQVISSTQISCVVPAGYGNNLPVTVHLGGYVKTFYVFSYLAPIVRNVTTAPTSGGHIVIWGFNFGPVGSPVTVKIGDTLCIDSIVAVNHSVITSFVNSGYGSSILLIVCAPAHPLCGNYTHFSYEAPTITSVSSPTTSGGQVDVQGTNFGPGGQKYPVDVTVDGNPYFSVVISETFLQFQIDPGYGQHFLAIEVGGQVSELVSFVFQAPRIVGATAVPTNGLTASTLFGFNFATNASVTIDGKDCQIATITDSIITFYPPVGVGGHYSLVLSVPSYHLEGTFRQEATYLFEYLSPLVSYIEPTNTNGNIPTTIVGDNFGPIGSPVQITIGNHSCDNASIVTSHTLIKCLVPEGSGQNLDVGIVVVPGTGHSLEAHQSIFYYNKPIVKGISEPFPSTQGGIVFINGSNFGPSGTPVSVNVTPICGEDTICTNATIYEAHTVIRCFAPSGSGVGNLLSVYVSGQYGSNSVFSYQSPVISSITSPKTEGALITIAGTNFGPLCTPVEVTLGDEGKKCTNASVVEEHTKIQCYAPSGVGQISLKLIAPNRPPFTQVSSLLVYQCPQIFNSTPVGNQGGVTILTGTNFGTDASVIQVFVGSVPCADVSIIVNHTTLSCRVQSGAGTNISIVVSVSGLSNSIPYQLFYFLDTTGPECSFVTASSVANSTTTTVTLHCNEPVQNVTMDCFNSTGQCIIFSLMSSGSDYMLELKQNTSSECDIELLPGSITDIVGNRNNKSAFTQIFFDIPVPQHSSDKTKKKVAIAVPISVGSALLLACLAAGLLLALTKKKSQPSEEEEEEFTLTSEGVALSLLPLQVSDGQLCFGIKAQHAKIDKEYTEEFSLTNTSKNRIAFKFFLPKKCAYKYSLQVVPREGHLQPAASIQISAKLAVHCTTILRPALIVATSKATLGGKFGSRQLKHSELPIVVDSKLSKKLDPDELNLIPPPVGEGAFGTVYRGTWRGQDVAIKVLKTVSDQAYAEFCAEVQMMESLNCPQIVTFIGAVHDRRKLIIVTEFMQHGSLGHVLKQKGSLTERQKVKILLDCARGMNFLHKSGVIHRDLKPDNLLLASLDASAPVCAKISDFGTTRDVTGTSTTMNPANMTAAVGTPTFMAPEALSGSEYGQMSDVYSFAILAYCVLTELEAYPIATFPNTWKIIEFVSAGKRPPFPDDFPEKYQQLLAQCWAQEPSDRIGFDKIAEILGAML
ncbi:protein serine/threonine kinase [Pelomyxa schiedti]|nr:protein serine/threonine kinase [Pelomyxa schiedti]